MRLLIFLRICSVSGTASHSPTSKRANNIISIVAQEVKGSYDVVIVMSFDDVVRRAPDGVSSCAC